MRHRTPFSYRLHQSYPLRDEYHPRPASTMFVLSLHTIPCLLEYILNLRLPEHWFAIAWSDIPSAPSILRRWSHVHSVIPGEPFVIARSRGSSQHAACAPAGQPPRPSFVPLAPASNLQPTHSPVNAVAPATCKCASSGLHYHLRQNCWNALITTRPY